MQSYLCSAASPLLRLCSQTLVCRSPLRPLAAFLSTQPAEESALKKTLLKYRANASKSRDKAVTQAYMQLANEIQAKLNVEAAASAENSRAQAAVKPAAAVEVTVTGSAKTGTPALKFRLPSSFKATTRLPVTNQIPLHASDDQDRLDACPTLFSTDSTLASRPFEMLLLCYRMCHIGMRAYFYK